MRALLATCAAALALAPLAGCGGGMTPKSADTSGHVGAKGEAAPVQAPADAAVKAGVAPAERKIIYTGTIDLVVTNLDEALPQVEKLVAAQKGYVAKSEVREDSGKRRSATFSLRIPVGGFQPARDGLLALGTPERNAVDSQDVTEEFVDVQARIKNLKEQEDKLNELLKEKRKEEKLDDIIKVSDRIAQVRGEVERVQGRLNYLASMTTLATINLTIREVKDYKPPTAPTFGNRIAATFTESWEALVTFGQGAVLFAVGISLWVAVLVPVALALRFGYRRWLRASRPATQ